MGGLSPALSKMEGRVPPVPPVAEPLRVEGSLCPQPGAESCVQPLSGLL